PDPLGIAVPAGIEMIELAHHRQDVVQLHRALDLRVAGEDLLDERRAGAGEPHDEDRRRIGIAGRCPGGEELRVAAGRDAPGFGLEGRDREGRGALAQLIAGGVVVEGLGVLLPLLQGAADGEVQLRLVGGGRRRCQQAAHRRELGVAEGVILEVREAPIGFRVLWVQPQAFPVGRLALRAPPECLVDVSDGEPESGLRGAEAGSLLIRRQRLLLAQQADENRAQCRPVLRVLRLELQQLAEDRFRLGQALGRQQRVAPRAAHERVVSAARARVRQQALGVARVAGADGDSGETGERGEMTRIAFQDFAEHALGGAIVAARERRRRFLDALPMGIEPTRALEGEARIGELAQLDQDVAVGEPCGLERRLALQHAAQLRARRLQASILPVGAREIDTGMREIGCGGDGALEDFQGGSQLRLRQQRHTEQMQAVDLPGVGMLDLPQPAFRGREASEPHVLERPPVGGPKLRLGLLRHAIIVVALLAACHGLTVCTARAGTVNPLAFAAAFRCTADPRAASTVPGWSIVSGSPALRCGGELPARWPSGAAPRVVIANGPYGASVLERSIALQRTASRQRRFTLSASFAAFGGRSARAVLTGTFLGASGRRLGTLVVLRGPRAAGRKLPVRFAARSVTGKVPDGAARMELRLDLGGRTAVTRSYIAAMRLETVPGMAFPPPAPPPARVPRFDHVVLIMMENTDFGQVIGDTRDAPYMNSLAARGTLLANYQAVYHPSDENYLAIAGGDTFVRGGVYFPNLRVAAPNLGDLLEGAGRSW